MIAMKVTTRSDIPKVIRKARRANIESLSHAGGAIRLTARRSIFKREGPSTPGRPPHTHTGALRDAIIYAVEKAAQRVLIGPAFAGVGTSGMAHEFGGHYRRSRYPQRAFMGPALEKLQNRLPSFWAGSVR